MRSDKNVYLMAKGAIRDGQDDAARALVEEICAATAKEPGALGYEWSLSEDGRTCHVLERYVDSDAVRAHLETIRPFADRMTSAMELLSMEVYGSPDEGARKILREFGAKFNQPYAGFVR